MLLTTFHKYFGESGSVVWWHSMFSMHEPKKKATVAKNYNKKFYSAFACLFVYC